MILEYFEISDTDESIFGLNEKLRVELEDDGVQAFNTKWDETIIPMTDVVKDQIVDIFILVAAPQLGSAHAIFAAVSSRHCSKMRIARPFKIQKGS